MQNEKLVSRVELARRIGISTPAIQYHLNQGYIAAPSVWIGKRGFYTEQEAKQLEIYFKRLLQARGGQ